VVVSAQHAQRALREAAEREIQPDSDQDGTQGGTVPGSSGGGALGGGLDQGGEEVVSTGGEERGASIEVGDLAVLQEMTAEEYAAGEA
jgi:hypothetical protein